MTPMSTEERFARNEGNIAKLQGQLDGLHSSVQEARNDIKTISERSNQQHVEQTQILTKLDSRLAHIHEAQRETARSDKTKKTIDYAIKAFIAALLAALAAAGIVNIDPSSDEGHNPEHAKPVDKE